MRRLSGYPPTKYEYLGAEADRGSFRVLCALIFLTAPGKHYSTDLSVPSSYADLRAFSCGAAPCGEAASGLACPSGSLVFTGQAPYRWPMFPIMSWRKWLLYFSLLTSCTYAGAAVKITTTNLPNGTVGVAYSAYVYASGGCKPYRWSWKNLPAFFAATPASNTSYLHLSGTPNLPNLYTFSISVRGCGGYISTHSYTITIAQAANISVLLSPTKVTLNPGQTQQFTATVAGSPRNPSWGKVRRSTSR